MKKTLFLFRLFALVATLTCAFGAHAYDFYKNGIYYIIYSSNEVWVDEGSGSGPSYSGSVNIPSSVTYGSKTYTVTGISGDAFFGCTGMTSVTIPNTVNRICQEAFGGCTGLTSLTLPASVEDIGFYAFNGCTNLTSITCLNPTPPKFYDLDGETEDLDPFSEVTYTRATLYVPMGSMSAYQATGHWKYWYKFLNIVELNDEGAYDFYKNGIYYSITSNSAVEVTNNGSYGTYSGNVTIPSSVSYGGKIYSVTCIGVNAFSRCTELTRVTIPNSVTIIGMAAFEKCTGLTSVTLPNSVKSISGLAFYECTGLTSVTLPNSLTFIGTSAFDGCSSLTSVTLPNSLTTLADRAFYGCTSLTSVTIPNSLTVIQEGTFQYCNSLASVTIPNSVIRIDKQAFQNCLSLTSVTIPNSVTLIGVRAFYNCLSLDSVTIGSSVTIIGDEAFSGCSALKIVECKANTPPTMDARTVFDNRHYSYTMLYVLPGRESAYQAANWWSSFSMIFEMKYDFMVNGIYYLITGANTVAVSYRDGNYNSYSGSVNIPSSVTYEGTTYQVTAIGDYAFNSCTGLTSVAIPNTVTSIGDNAFQQCGTIENIVIPNSVTSIGNLAFMLCDNITYMVIPNSVTTIGVGVFWDCQLLEHVVIGSSVTSIGEGAFMECGRLNNVECLASTPPTMAASNVFDDYTYSTATLKVPVGCQSAYQAANWWKNFVHIEEPSYDFLVNGIYYIITGNNTVSVCHGPMNHHYSGSITIPETVTQGNKTYQVTAIARYAFRGDYMLGNPDLTSVKLSTVIHDIGDYSFISCTNLTSIDLSSASVRTIGDQVFEGCEKLEYVSLGENLQSIGMSAFKDCSALTEISCEAETPPAIYSGTFSAAQNASATVYVPYNSLNAYKTANHWANFMDIRSFGDLYDFMVDGIYYRLTDHITDENTVSVVRRNPDAQDTYSGDVVIPPYVTWRGTEYRVDGIDPWVFGNSEGVTSVTIPNTVTYIGEGAFYECVNMTDVTFGNSLEQIGIFAFHTCSLLTSVTIPNSVVKIEMHAFSDCAGLTSVTIGSGVTDIGQYAFAYILDMTSVTCLAETPPTVSYHPFDEEVYEAATLYVPQNSVTAYQNAEGWRNFTTILPLPASGDVDDDGQVGIADATILIDLILTGGNVPASADVDGNGSVDIADVTALIDMILTGN